MNLISQIFYLLKEDLVQEQAPSSVDVEDKSLSSEKGDSDLTSDATVSPVIKVCKAPKAGEKASQGVLKLWKDNGFSR